MKGFILRLFVGLSVMGLLILVGGNLWAAGGGHAGGFKAEVGWQIIGFIIVGGFLAYVLKKPMRSFLRKRREEIRSALDQAGKKETDSHARLEEWERKLNSLSQEIQGLHDAVKEEAERERHRLIERAREEGDRIRKQAQAIADQEMRKARATLKSEAVNLSMGLAESLLKESTKPQDQERLVKEYIERMKEIH